MVLSGAVKLALSSELRFIFSIFKDAYLERIYGKRKTNAIGADAWFDNLWLHCIRWSER